MSKLERIKKVCKWLIYVGHADNDTELAKKLGYTKSSFSQIINGKVVLSDKFIDALCKLDDNINKVWIEEEKGTITKNQEDITINLFRELILTKNDVIKAHEISIQALQELIVSLKSAIDNKT